MNEFILEFKVLLHGTDGPASAQIEDVKQITLAIEEALKDRDNAALIVREVRWAGAA